LKEVLEGKRDISTAVNIYESEVGLSRQVGLKTDGPDDQGNMILIVSQIQRFSYEKELI
jgi:hypothetical protein